MIANTGTGNPGHHRQPLLSVIILSYNDYAGTTGPCLESLRRAQTPAMELIVVDNGSERDTLSQLEQAARRDSRIRLICNATNRGYAGGNNDGVQAATGEFIVLLNSDTVVLPESLVVLWQGLDRAPAPVIIGPVTNAAGTEQQIHCVGEQVEDILAEGLFWSRHGHGSLLTTDRLTFFCVAMHRTTYQALSGLDESFGQGFYEDTDFCLRARAQGIALQIMEEAFVYHQGSASFSKDPEMVQVLLKKNKQRLRQKHGRVREKHTRLKNLDVLTGYLAQKDTGEADRPAIAYRFANRMLRAEALAPRNLLKRWFYARQLARLRRGAVGQEVR